VVNDGLLAAGEVGRRESAKVARRYRLRKIVGRQGVYHILECHHRALIPTSEFGVVESRASRRCHQCPVYSEVCVCAAHQSRPHWKDEHRPGCAQCGCHRFKAMRMDLR